MTTSIDKIKSLKEQIKNEVDGIKAQLATELKAACATVKQLTDLGETDILKDTRLTPFLEILAPSVVVARPPKGKGDGKRLGGDVIEAAIYKALAAKPLTANEIQAALEVSLKDEYTKIGKTTCPLQLNKIRKMKEDKLLIFDDATSLYSVPKK